MTQRGNRRQKVFFSKGDYGAYVELMAAWCGVEVWAYCLMPNDVHLVVVPSSAAAHVAGADDALVTAEPMCGRVLEHWGDWRTYLLGSSAEIDAEDLPAKLHRHETTGRALGSRPFVEKLQDLLGRPLLPKKRGPKPKAKKRARDNYVWCSRNTGIKSPFWVSEAMSDI